MGRIVDLLDAARNVGLRFPAVNDRLRICDPKSAEAIARQLLARKAEVLTVLKESSPFPESPACGRRMALIPSWPPDCTTCRLAGRPVPVLPHWEPPDGPRLDPARAEACRREAEEYRRAREVWLKQFPATSPEITQKQKSATRKKRQSVQFRERSFDA
jgi:hypothetical protein